MRKICAMTDFERITVNLTPKTAAALAAAMERDQLSKTEVVNRALRVYAFLAEAADTGQEVLVRNAAGETDRIKFF
jgi:hypothetical protein